MFDFDGVIADSEPFSLSTLRDTLAEFGLDMSLDQVPTGPLMALWPYSIAPGTRGWSGSISQGWK